jgi:multiple sugar transport system permease protein
MHTARRIAVQAPSRLSRQDRRRLLVGLAFISPWIVGFLVFTLWPILTSLYYAFTDYSLFSAPVWAGTRNFSDLFFADDKFLVALYNTLYFTMLAIPASIVGAFVMALAVNVRLPEVAIYRGIFFLPTIVPTVATAVVWTWILNPQWGLLNAFLRLLGINGPPWIASPVWSKPSLVIMAVWGVGSEMLIYLAALQDIPQTYYEAASLDGATFWHRTRYIVVPLLTPVIFFHLITGTIWGFQYFTEAYVMTGGGPANSTLFYALYLYRNAFEYLKMGYASAMAWILFLIVLGATVMIQRSSGGWVYYEGQH